MANLILNTEVDNFLQSNSKASMRTALNLKSAALEEASTFATKVENDLKIGRTQIDSTNFQYTSNELQLIDGSIDSTKIGEGSITKDRIEDLSSMTLLGNTTTIDNAPAEVGIITETAGIDNNDNDTSIPTSAAVKDYVTDYVTHVGPFYRNITNIEKFNQTANTQYTYDVTSSEFGSLDATRVTGVHVLCYMRSENAQTSETRIEATLGGITNWYKIKSNYDYEDAGSSAMIYIPMGKTQSEFKLRMNTDGNSDERYKRGWIIYGVSYIE